MKKAVIVLDKVLSFIRLNGLMVAMLFLLFVVVPTLGQGPDDLDDVEDEVQNAWESLQNIIEIFFIGALVIGGGYVIWAFSSKLSKIFQSCSHFLSASCISCVPCFGYVGFLSYTFVV